MIYLDDDITEPNINAKAIAINNISMVVYSFRFVVT